MLLCKDCDYYHAICRKDCEGSAVSFCKFTDILFLKDTDDLEGEYPCRSVSFSDYLKKESACACDGAEVQKYRRPALFRELEENGVGTLKFPVGILGGCFQG